MDYPGRRVGKRSLYIPPDIPNNPPDAPAGEPSQTADEESDDPLDVMSEDEELMAQELMFAGLMDFGANAGLGDKYLDFDDAFEYVFKSTNKLEHAIELNKMVKLERKAHNL